MSAKASAGVFPVRDDLRTSVAASDGQTTGKLLEFAATELAKKLNRQPFLIRHHLVSHPLLELAALLELARRLPEAAIEYNAGNLPVTQDPQTTPRTGLSVEETLRRIAECQSWMVLKNVETDAAYRSLLDDCLDEVEAVTRRLHPQMCRREAFIFISSPGSVTPYHMDPEYNFLLQIRGSKTMHVFDGSDRSICSEEELEQYLCGGHRNLNFKEEYQQQASSFVLQPGDGLHVPVTYPHWVKNGDAVSISLSITFHTEVSERRKMVYSTNAYLRRRGIKPTAYGKFKYLDNAKVFALRAARRTRHWFGSEA